MREREREEEGEREREREREVRVSVMQSNPAIQYTCGRIGNVIKISS